MVGDDESTRVVPGPVRRVQGRGDRSLPPTGEGGGRRYARERICNENEAHGRDWERGPGDAEEDRHDSEDQDDSDRRGVCSSTIAKPRIPGPVPPSDSGPRIDDRPEENESEPEQDEDRPPRPYVHVGEDEFSEGRRVDEPVHERPGEEETRIRDLSFRPGRPSPWASETPNDDRTQDHEEEEVEGQMVRRDQRPRHEDERDHGPSIGPKAEKEEEAREGEQIPDGRGGRVRGRICVGYRADQEGGREEGDAVLARDTPCDQEDRDDGQSAQDRHE